MLNMQIRTLQSRMENTEQEILEQIDKYIKKRNLSPSIRELSKLCKSVNSTSTIKAYLDRMKEKGLIDYEPRTPRSIRIKKD
ncbi:LexA family protein [Fredinandcohnia humi]